MGKVDLTRKVIDKHCNNCCIGLCEVCIINTIRVILNYGGNIDYAKSRTKTSYSRKKARG